MGIRNIRKIDTIIRDKDIAYTYAIPAIKDIDKSKGPQLYDWYECSGHRVSLPIFTIVGTEEDVTETIQHLRDSNTDEKFNSCIPQIYECFISDTHIILYFSLYLTNEPRENFNVLPTVKKLILDIITRRKRYLARHLMTEGYLSDCSYDLVKECTYTLTKEIDESETTHIKEIDESETSDI